MNIYLFSDKIIIFAAMKAKNLEKQPQQRRTCRISVPDYLARYARYKFDMDSQTGGIRIPDSFDLYDCVWKAMAKWPVEHTWLGLQRRADAPDGNLLIHLPCRRKPVNGLRKNPCYWNYISPRAAYIIICELRKLFNKDLYDYVDSKTNNVTRVAAVRQFCHDRDLGIDAEDALLKNLQRRDRKKHLILNLSKNLGK